MEQFWGSYDFIKPLIQEREKKVNQFRDSHAMVDVLNAIKVWEVIVAMNS